ncbi:MAG: hypothetical protein WC375_05790 [Methanomassiliicoccales archaeon]
MSNSSGSVLYFPSIEFSDDNWVKATLLFWDKIYRITPNQYSPNDNETILEAIDNDLIRDIPLEGKDLSKTADKFEKFCNDLPFIPAGLESDEYERIHADKVDARLYPFLESIAHKFDDNRWLHLSKPLAKGYMFYLSKVVAERRNLARATDNPDSWAIAPYFSEDGKFDENVYRDDAEGYYSYLILEDFIPSDLINVPITKIIDFIDENKESKAKFRNKISEFAQNLSKCDSTDFALELIEDYKFELEESKTELTNSLSLINSGKLNALFTIGIPVGASVFGALGFNGNPYSFINIFGSILFGALASYYQYSVGVKKIKENSSLTYLVNMDSQLSKVAQCSSALDEFIND